MSNNESRPEDTPTNGNDAAPRSNRSAMFIVFFIVVIDLLGFGIVLPLLPLYGETFVEKLFSDKSSPMAGVVLGLLMASFSAMQFVFAPIWGRISDRVGRRPILLIGLAGSVVFYALFGYASTLIQSPTLAVVLLFVARIGAGMAGATIATAQAVIADCTPPEKRKHGMAMIGAAFGIGFALGPLFGYVALTISGGLPEAIGYVAAGTSLIALLLGLRMLPETRQFDTAPPLQRGWINLGAFRQVLGNPALFPVILTYFLATLGFGAFEATLALLNKDSLGFADKDNLLIFAYVGFVLMLTQGFLYRRLAKKMTEPTLMAIGICLMGVGVISLGGLSWLRSQETLTPDGMLPLLLVCLAVSVVGFAFLTPSAQALISRRSEQNVQGETLGVNQSASAMARILGPIFGLSLYFLESTHVLPFVLGGALVLCMLPLIPRIRRGGEDGSSTAENEPLSKPVGSEVSL